MARPRRQAVCHPDRKHLSRGLCSACYQRKLRVGELTARPPRARLRAACHPDRWNYARGQCRPCYNVSAHGRAVARRGALKFRFGITPTVYREKRAAQGDRCAICRSPQHGKTMHVDHDHSTGQIRSLLCGTCNTGIGHLGDSPMNAFRAMGYLSKHKFPAALTN